MIYHYIRGVIVGKSFDFVRKLIEAERFKDYKKEYWGGADVIIVSETEYENKKNDLEKWTAESPSRKLVKTKYASAVIWLIETLKPYVNYDYLSKYEYYEQLAEFVESHKKYNDEELLLCILNEIENGKISCQEKRISAYSVVDSELDTWYKFGIEHNNPFFVKFMTLWFAFNCEYKNYPGILRDDNGNPRLDRNSKQIDDVEYMKITEWCDARKKKLESIYDEVFKSPLIDIFMEKEVDDMRKEHATRINRENYNVLKYSVDEYERTLALFQTMYQVRCNLFHGSKSPNVERDFELVRCSGEILEIYLKQFL